MEKFELKRGDAFYIPVTIKLNGTAVDTDDIEKVEFMLGHHIRKLYPDDVTYASGEFRLPLTQEETFGLSPERTLDLDVRVKFSSGVVTGTLHAAQVTIRDAVSGEVL